MSVLVWLLYFIVSDFGWLIIKVVIYLLFLVVCVCYYGLLAECLVTYLLCVGL